MNMSNHTREGYSKSISKAMQASRTTRPTADSLDGILACEKSIAQMGPEDYAELLKDKQTQPNDGFLRLWNGLRLDDQGHANEACEEFLAAGKLGCTHWRVGWYLALAARRAGRLGMMEKACAAVLSANPDFLPARELPKHAREDYGQMGQDKIKTNPFSSPKTMNTILVNTFDYDSCSAGVRVMHYLAALLHSADVPVAVTSPCFYDPTIPVRPQALPDDIVVYPDASRGNVIGAARICRYMLYYAHAYFGGDRIAKNECAIVYHQHYLADVQAHCDHLLTEDDVVTLPILDQAWCFPEAKTIENVLYVGKGKGKPLPQIDYTPIAAANAPENRAGAYADHYAHMRTLAMLRKAKNFYTPDENTLMSCEAALCGCKVFYVRDANTFEEQTGLLEKARAEVMSPERDVARARRFADRVYRFFATESAAQNALRANPQGQITNGGPAFTPQNERTELRRPVHGRTGSPKIKMGVLSLEGDRTACAYLRWVAPLSYLRAQDRIECLPLVEVVNNHIKWIKENVRQVQLIVVQRSMPMFLPYHVLRGAIENPSVKIVFELDDALTMVPGNHPAFGCYQAIRPQIEAYLRNADLVTVSTPQLKEIYSCYNDHIEVLPNTVDTQIWLPSPPKARHQGKVRILFSGTLTHQNDLASIEQAIERILQEFGDGATCQPACATGPRSRTSPSLRQTIGSTSSE